MVETQSQDEVRAKMSALSAAQKAQFTGVTREGLQRLLEAQSDLHGPVEVDDVVALTDGAGASNGITFFTAELDRGNGRQTERLVARYDPGITLLKQKSFTSEFATMRAINSAGLPAAKAHWLDADGSLLGAPGYIIDRIDGASPSPGVFDKGLLVDSTSDDRFRMIQAAAEFHGHLRKVALPAERVPHLLSRGKGNSAIERELNWWFREVELHDPTDAQLVTVRALAERLMAKQPQTYPANLVHGDAQFANIMFHNGRLAAVLDWELAYLGQNESDLALLTFCIASLKPEGLEGVPSEQDLVLAFERASGDSIQHWEFFQAFNLFKWVSSSFLYPGAPMFDHYRNYLEEALDGVPG